MEPLTNQPIAEKHGGMKGVVTLLSLAVAGLTTLTVYGGMIKTDKVTGKTLVDLYIESDRPLDIAFIKQSLIHAFNSTEKVKH